MSILDLLLRKIGYIPKEEHEIELIKLVKQYEAKIKNLKYAKPEVQHYRRAGNTTRLADWYIQELYNKKEIKVQDHYYDKNNRQPSKILFDIILGRLKTEHRWNFTPDKIRIDRTRLTIRIGQFPMPRTPQVL